MDTNLITNRRAEVEAEIARCLSRVDEMRKELVDLAIAERVLTGLTGAARPEVGQRDGEKPEATAKKPANLPSVPEMIRNVMQGSYLLGGYEPKEVRERIAQQFWPGIKGDNVASILWRMERRGELLKEGGRYMLPPNDEAPDAVPEGSTSEASLFNPSAQGREAGPGGGTS